MEPAGVYRSRGGKVWRVLKSEDGAISVQVLEDGRWIPGPIGLVGLRLAGGTTRLSEEAVHKLVV